MSSIGMREACTDVHGGDDVTAEVAQRDRDGAQTEFELLVHHRISLRAGARNFQRQATKVALHNAQ